MAISLQQVIRSTSCLVLGWGFRGRQNIFLGTAKYIFGDGKIYFWLYNSTMFCPIRAKLYTKRPQWHLNARRFDFDNSRWQTDLHRNVTNADATIYCWEARLYVSADRGDKRVLSWCDILVELFPSDRYVGEPDGISQRLLLRVR